MNDRERTDKQLDIKELHALFREIGWGPCGAEKWRRVLERSSYIYSVWDNTKLIGLGRILEDGVMCMFYDIGVLPEYQGRGLGSRITHNLIEQVKDKHYASIGLFTWEGNPINIPFYRKFGFEVVPTGMELIKHMCR